ncbi:hypothetical protein HanIR_Chr11g0524181 [Helianthus annuus]|nr:hypothetical protein HanIR_Chr11g0524181 [Helianthus annuus]
MQIYNKTLGVKTGKANPKHFVHSFQVFHFINTWYVRYDYKNCIVFIVIQFRNKMI